MAKKVFHPVVLSGLDPGGSVIGGGSGHGGLFIPAVPMAYSDWLISVYADDYIEDGSINAWDFGVWWGWQGFSQADWERLNPDLDWDLYGPY